MRLLWPSKNIGTTRAPDFVIIFAVNDLQLGSMGLLKGAKDVETVPPGNIPTAPPEFKKSKAAALVWIFNLEASLV